MGGGGRQQESSNINRMLDGRLAYQKESQAGRGRRYGGLGVGWGVGGAGGEEKSPVVPAQNSKFRARLPGI